MGGPRIPQLLVSKNGRGTRGWGRTFLSSRPGRTRHVPISYDIARTNRNGRSEILQRSVFTRIFQTENMQDVEKKKTKAYLYFLECKSTFKRFCNLVFLKFAAL